MYVNLKLLKKLAKQHNPKRFEDDKGIIYLQLQTGKKHKTLYTHHEFNKDYFLNMDVDEDGNIIGIEIL